MARRGLPRGSPSSEAKAGELVFFFQRERERERERKREREREKFFRLRNKNEKSFNRLRLAPPDGLNVNRSFSLQESREEHASLPAGPADAGVPFLILLLLLLLLKEEEQVA